MPIGKAYVAPNTIGAFSSPVAIAQVAVASREILDVSHIELEIFDMIFDAAPRLASLHCTSEVSAFFFGASQGLGRLSIS